MPDILDYYENINIIKSNIETLQSSTLRIGSSYINNMVGQIKKEFEETVIKLYGSQITKEELESSIDAIKNSINITKSICSCINNRIDKASEYQYSGNLIAAFFGKMTDEPLEVMNSEQLHSTAIKTYAKIVEKLNEDERRELLIETLKLEHSKEKNEILRNIKFGTEMAMMILKTLDISEQYNRAIKSFNTATEVRGFLQNTAQNCINNLEKGTEAYATFYTLFMSIPFKMKKDPNYVLLPYDVASKFSLYRLEITEKIMREMLLFSEVYTVENYNNAFGFLLEDKCQAAIRRKRNPFKKNNV